MIRREEFHALDASEINRAIARESSAERLWKAIPIMGWGIASAMWVRRNRPARDALCRQLQARPADVRSAWGEDEAFVHLGETVREIARREMGWPSNRFLPWDPYRVVFWSFDDGLDLEEAMMEIGDRIGYDLLSDQDIARWAEGDLGSFVRELLLRSRPTA